MNRATAIVLLVCTSGSVVALLALGTLLAVGWDSSATTLLGWLIFGGGTATVVTILGTVTLATAADRRAPWRAAEMPPRLYVVRDAIDIGPPPELEGGR